MTTEILIALLSFAGTFVGALMGVVASSRLTNHRLAQLEKKVDEHNKVVKRTYVLEEKAKVSEHRISDLEAWQNNQ